MHKLLSQLRKKTNIANWKLNLLQSRPYLCIHHIIILLLAIIVIVIIVIVIIVIVIIVIFIMYNFTARSVLTGCERCVDIAATPNFPCRSSF